MRVLLIDDQHLVRQGMRCLLATIPGVQITEAVTSSDAIASFRKAIPDVVILSSALERASGPELLKRFLKEANKARVLMLGQGGEIHLAARAIHAGAKGFITRYASSAELIAAVHRVAEGKKYIDKDIAAVLASKKVAGEADLLEILTLREIEIIRLLGQGKSMKAIASNLGVAYKTVANACTVVKAKLGLKRTADLIRLAVDMERP